MTELLLLRHGATAGNLAHRYVGRRTDEALSDQGIDQCRRLGACQGLGHVYVSPLARARETARLCFPFARAVVVEDLAEMDFGIFEGRCAAEMEGLAAYRSWVEGSCLGRCPEGESYAEFAARTTAALADILMHEVAREAPFVVVVAHGGTVMAALDGLATAANRKESPFGWHVGPCEGVLTSVIVGRCEPDPQRVGPARGHDEGAQRVDPARGHDESAEGFDPAHRRLALDHPRIVRDLSWIASG